MYPIRMGENGMNRLKRHPSVWVCGLLLLSFIMAGHSHAQCTMTSGQLDAAVASCKTGDLDCFVSLAKNNVSCAANIAWYYMIVYAPEDPTPVLDSFLYGLPYASDLSDDISAAINAAFQANQNQQKAGSLTSANEYPYKKPYDK